MGFLLIFVSAGSGYVHWDSLKARYHRKSHSGFVGFLDCRRFPVKIRIQGKEKKKESNESIAFY